MYNIPRLVIAAPASGGGKTTLTCALLQLWKSRGKQVAAFKCGPDYIDPMFHRRILGTKSRNLDLYFASEALARGLFCQGAQGCQLAVIEGVMGFYDGVGGSTSQASAYHVAQTLAAPVVLVLEPKGASLTLAAQVKGLAEFRAPSGIAALVLNRCSPALYQSLKPMLEQETGLPVLGYLPKLPQCSLESRHLGLVTAQEVEGLQEKMEALAREAERTLGIQALEALAQSAPPLAGQLPQVEKLTESQPVIALAQDAAFCFYYPENLELLEQMGVKLKTFSPLANEELPPGTCGVYLGGGYPELYAQQLSEKRAWQQSLARAHAAGMPIFAECGGFMALHEHMEDGRGGTWPMAGLVPGTSFATGRLGRFGYVELTAQENTLLCTKGQSIRAHEFHYWDSQQPGESFEARKPVSGRGWRCIQARGNLLAGYPHLYFYNNPAFAAGFVRAVAAFQKDENHVE